MLQLFLIFVVGFLASILLTPLTWRLAIRCGIVDLPDGRRKLHQKMTPLGGGVSVFIGSLVALIFAAFVTPQIWSVSPFTDSPFLLGLAIASAFIVLIGLIDDRHSLRGRHKLLGQIFVGLIIAMSGLSIEKIQLFQYSIVLGVLTIPFTIFWIVGAINAVNLLDGVDGLATSIGMVLSLAISLMALMVGRNLEAVIALSLAGSLAGFLIYNAPPAKIFLGDSGSMLIGLILGTLAIRCSFKGPATIALAIPLTVLAIPVLDVSMAILRRRLTGRSIYSTDRGHMHHVMQQRGYSGRRTVFMIVICSACTATGAIVSIYQENELVAIGSTLLVVGLMIFSRLFGHAEMSLLYRRSLAFTLSLFRGIIPPQENAEEQKSQQIQSHLQGCQEWTVLWDSLVTYASQLHFTKVIFNITAPALHEEFHAEWKQDTHGGDDEWEMSLPIMGGENHLMMGQLHITGKRQPRESVGEIAELIAGLKPFEEQIHTLLEEIERDISEEIETATSPATVSESEILPPPVLEETEFEEAVSASSTTNP